MKFNSAPLDFHKKLDYPGFFEFLIRYNYQIIVDFFLNGTLGDKLSIYNPVPSNFYFLFSPFLKGINHSYVILHLI